MISSHVTYFILFHWSDIFFFSFSSSFSFKSSLASQNAFSLVWIRHRSSSWTTLVYILFDFIYGGVVCFLECREISAPSPSLSVPSLAVPGVTISTKSIDPFPVPVPVLHSLVWLVPVWMCSLVHHALLRSVSLALTVLLWAGENKQKGYQLFRKWEMGFPQLIFCSFLSTVFFSIQCDLFTLGVRLRKEYQGLWFLLHLVLFLWDYLWFIFFLSWDTTLKSPLLSLFSMQR